MNKYILVAFAVMGVGFYELSGGDDFEPGDNSIVIFAEPKPFVPNPEPAVVARADIQPANLTDIAAVRVPLKPAPQPLDADTNHARAALTPSKDETGSQQTVVIRQAAVEVPEYSLPEPDPDPVRDLRFVDGNRVNMRGGPGTEFAVIGQLLRDDMVEVIKDEGNGWLHLRVSATGEEGWMADWLVTAAN